MSRTFKIILASFLITAGAIKAAPAQAAPQGSDSSQVSASVRTADLDLSTRAGQRALEQRLAIAVVEVCGTPSDVDLAGKNRARACRAETSARLAVERDRRIAGAVDPAQPIRLAAR